MGTGLPVIGTRHSGIPEAIHDGENGIVVEEKDVEGLRNAIQYFSNSNHRLAAGGKSREIAESHFEAKRQAEALLGLFRGVLSDSLLSNLNPNPDHSSTVSAGPPLPRDCAGRAELQHDQQEAWSAEASSHLLGFDLRLAAHSLWPRPDFHPLPG